MYKFLYDTNKLTNKLNRIKSAWLKPTMPRMSWQMPRMPRMAWLKPTMVLRFAWLPLDYCRDANFGTFMTHHQIKQYLRDFFIMCLVFYLFIVVFLCLLSTTRKYKSVQMLLTKRTHKHKKYITEKNNDPIIEQKSISMERKTNEPKKTSKATQVQFHSILTSEKFSELLRCEKSARKSTKCKHTFLVRDRQ